VDDIVDRLRHMAWLAPEGEPYADALLEAADEIERLREERLNELLAKSLASKTVRRRRSPRSNNG
jgi:hypothetical protein